MASPDLFVAARAPVATALAHVAATAGPGRRRLDATAQAAGLARQLGLTGHPACGRVRGALARCSHPLGGLRYEPDSEHVNSWATAFAVRAVAGQSQRW